ncbi:unnamed protein product [Acanthoscelides obtectus]|uniref:TIMELESS-interacting protein n=1 Tax=Acanthoscelides obtectus TaxID=200917 RepID=A0A9P0NWC3_ACAOB|nr:unnamed protein product [Acanthoscelides obtectus]CAK1679357.1 TIMELESS-interacting protein [Acanthoscelides obtectus]
MSSDEESVHSIVEEVENELDLHPEDDNAEGTEEQPTEEANGSQNAEDEAEEERAKNVVKPKRVVKNPQPKLNEQTLRGPRGLSAIEGYFQRVKFKGKGHEEHDLNMLMKTYEYWCHRLFPKFPFDHCIARLETLGTKKGTQTLLKLIRMDMATDTHIVSDNEEEQEDNHQESTEPTQDAFDQLLPSTSGTQAQSTNDSQELPEDIQDRIRQNRERAERLRRERLQKARDQAAVSLPGSSRITESQSIQNQVSVNGDVADSQTGKNNEVGTIDDLLDEINSKDFNSEKHKNSAVVDSDEEADQNDIPDKNKSSDHTQNSSANAKKLLSESIEDDNNHSRTHKRCSSETIDPESEANSNKRVKVNGIYDSDDEDEKRIRKKKTKLMDSEESDTEGTMNDINTKENSDNKNHSEDEKIIKKKKANLMDSEESETEGTIDQLLDDINTKENPDKNHDSEDEDLHEDHKIRIKTKRKVIESDEEENDSNSRRDKMEDTKHRKKTNLIASDSESDNENDINRDNMVQQSQDKSHHINNSTIDHMDKNV